MLHEQAMMLPVADQSLAAVLSPGSASTGLLLVVGGPQYRVGSHRQFVKLCRAAAANRIPAFRFDVAGMGGFKAPYGKATLKTLAKELKK